MPPESAATLPPRRRPRLCTRCAASARQRSCADSRTFLPIHFSGIDSNSTQEIGKTRIGTEGSELGMKQKAICCRGMFIECAVEPAKCFVFFAEGYVNDSDRICRDILLARFLYKLIEITARVFSPPHFCISDRQSGAGKLPCGLSFFIKCNRLFEITFFAISVG